MQVDSLRSVAYEAKLRSVTTENSPTLLHPRSPESSFSRRTMESITMPASGRTGVTINIQVYTANGHTGVLQDALTADVVLRAQQKAMRHAQKKRIARQRVAELQVQLVHAQKLVDHLRSQQRDRDRLSVYKSLQLLIISQHQC